MSTQKRSRTDGHLSKEQYNAGGGDGSSSTQVQGFALGGFGGGGSSASRVADQDTLTARKIARTGAARMRLLNTKFKDAVAGVLAKDAEADLTFMVADYLSYSTRVRQTFLADHGQVHMCGNGDCGQLGFGTEEMRDMEVKAPRLLPGLSKHRVITVACGGIANAALTESGGVFTWGSSDDGGLGRPGGPDAPEQFPGEVTEGLEGATIVALASGDCQTIALDISGRVYGWGCYKDKEGKQWFQPPAGAASKACKGACKSPVVISGLPSDVVEVKCGASFCLALTSKGGVFSWGIGEIGELGREVCSMKVPPAPGSDEEPPYDFDGVLRDHLTPGGMYRGAGEGGSGGVERMENVKAIGCGEYHSLVVTRSDSDVYACGLNSYGQLGLGDTDNRKRLALVEGLIGLNTMAAAGGAQHSLVLTTEGLFSFGRNDSGQLGCTASLGKDDWGAFEKNPMEVHLPDDAGNPVKVECGTNHCLVITDKHELYTWGYGETCALGHGNDADYSLPKKVDTMKRGITKVLDADGGGQHSAILGETANS
ncbi:unnamed protein product [Pylaiella littoralis]